MQGACIIDYWDGKESEQKLWGEQLENNITPGKPF